MSDSRKRLFDILYGRSFIYREDPPFKLVSGRESFYYFDCKATTLDPEGITLVGELLYDLVKDTIAAENVTGIGGMTLGADPISLSTAMRAYSMGQNIYPIIVRKEPKKHGTQKWIEGIVAKVKNIIVIDDVITTGGSTITAIERIRESGLNVACAAVLVDREEGGRENIENTGVRVLSLFTRADFDKRRLEEQ